MVVSKKEKKYIKRWKKLGFDYFEIKELFNSMSNTEKMLTEAIGICKGQTEKLKAEEQKRKKAYDSLMNCESVR